MPVQFYARMQRLFSTFLAPQFIRYAVVGVTSNLTLYVAYLFITASGLGPKLTMSLLYVSGVAATFVANRSWTFEHKGVAHTALVRYVAAYVIGYLLNLGLLVLGVDVLGLPHQAVQALAIVVVAVSLFLMHKYWVFASPTGQNAV